MSKTSEDYGCIGCLVIAWLPVIIFFSAYAAHCGWSMYGP